MEWFQDQPKTEPEPERALHRPWHRIFATVVQLPLRGGGGLTAGRATGAGVHALQAVGIRLRQLALGVGAIHQGAQLGHACGRQYADLGIVGQHLS